LNISSNVTVVNPKFNSVLKGKLKNKVEFDHDKLNYDELTFLYLNFNMSYQQYELLIMKLTHSNV
jgi:hypothetical protein